MRQSSPKRRRNKRNRARRTHLAYRFPRAAVAKAGRGGLYPWCFSSIRIRHSIASYPTELQFKALGESTKIVLGQLKSLGYPAR